MYGFPPYSSAKAPICGFHSPPVNNARRYFQSLVLLCFSPQFFSRSAFLNKSSKSIVIECLLPTSFSQNRSKPPSRPFAIERCGTLTVHKRNHLSAWQTTITVGDRRFALKFKEVFLFIDREKIVMPEIESTRCRGFFCKRCHRLDQQVTPGN